MWSEYQFKLNIHASLPSKHFLIFSESHTNHKMWCGLVALGKAAPSEWFLCLHVGDMLERDSVTDAIFLCHGYSWSCAKCCWTAWWASWAAAAYFPLSNTSSSAGTAATPTSRSFGILSLRYADTLPVAWVVRVIAVLIEKAICSRRLVWFCTFFVVRWELHFQFIRSAVDIGKIGDLISSRSSYRIRAQANMRMLLQRCASHPA